MWLIWFTFVSSLALVLWATWNSWRRARGREIVDFVKRPVRWQFDAMLIFLGVIGVVSCVPGLFFEQPHWAIDHVWWIIGKVTGNAV